MNLPQTFFFLTYLYGGCLNEVFSEYVYYRRVSHNYSWLRHSLTILFFYFLFLYSFTLYTIYYSKRECIYLSYAYTRGCVNCCMPLQQLLSEELRYDKCTVLISPYLGYIISYIMHCLSGWLANGYDEIFDWQSRLTVSSLSKCII